MARRRDTRAAIRPDPAKTQSPVPHPIRQRMNASRPFIENGFGRHTEKTLRVQGLSLLVATLLTLAACSRSGTLFGDVVVPVPLGAGNPAARLSVQVIPATAPFEREWAEALAAFQEALAPAQRAEEGAMTALDQAKLAWDRALAAPRGRRRSPEAAARERTLWRQVRESEQRLVHAKRQVWEIAQTNDLRGIKLLDQYAAQLVQTDGTGHYVLADLPVGPIFLYARVPVGGRSLVWFQRVQVRAGAQRLDLTEANRGGWPFGS